MLSYLILPDLEGESEVDLKANYYENRQWLFGILSAVPLLSLAEEYLRDGRPPWDADLGFRVAFFAFALTGMWIRSERFHAVNAGLGLLMFCAYIFLLFLQLV